MSTYGPTTVVRASDPSFGFGAPIPGNSASSLVTRSNSARYLSATRGPATSRRRAVISLMSSRASGETIRVTIFSAELAPLVRNEVLELIVCKVFAPRDGGSRLVDKRPRPGHLIGLGRHR